MKRLMITQTKKAVQKSLIYVTLLTLLSRMLGFWQDQSLIKFFAGAMAQSDAFLVAFRIPNILRRIIGDGLVNAALIPVMVQLFQAGEKKRGLRLLTLFFLVATLIFGSLWLLAWHTPTTIINLFAPGLGAEQLCYAKMFLPRMFGFVFFVAGCEIMSVGLRSVGHFLIPALGPSLYIITMIISLLMANRFSWSSNNLAWMVTIGALLKFLVRYAVFKHFRLSFQTPNSMTNIDARKVFTKMIPLLCGFGISQTHIITEGIIGSFLATGEISILHYSWRLLNIPIVMLNQATSTVLLPYFSSLNLLSHARLHFIFFECIKLLFWIGLPLAILVFCSATNISELLYGATSSASQSISKSTIILKILSLGIISSLINQVLCVQFYALKDTLAPSSINGTTTILNIIGSAIGLKYLGLPGIPLSTILSSLITTPILFFMLWKKHNIKLPYQKTIYFLATCCLQICVFFILKRIIGYYTPIQESNLIYGLYLFNFFTRKIFGIKLFMLS